MIKLPSIPSLSSKVAPEIRSVLAPVREILTNLMSGPDRIATVNDLRRTKLISGVDFNGQVIPTDDFSLSPPPMPTGLTAGGALAMILLQWDYSPSPLISYTEVWRSSTNDFSTAQYVGRSDWFQYVDSVGAAATRYYWVRYVSKAGIKGNFNAQAGVMGQTGNDPAYLLATLTGQIREGQLYTDLNSRIDLIDASASVSGSVAQRLASAVSMLSGVDTELSSQVSVVAANVATNASAIIYEATARANADSALSSQITTVAATAAGNTAAISTEATARANADSALSSQISTVSSTTNTNTAAIQTEATTRSTETGNLFGKYTVKIDLNGYVTGYGLASTNNNGTPTSEFAVRADRFYVASPNVSPIIPFVVQTLDETINGVLIPAGVYMDAAYIKNLTALITRLGTAWIDNAMIANLDAGKINTGYLSAGRILAGSLDAKIATLDAAVIGTGIINSARINTASLNNATIGFAQVIGTLAANRINATTLSSITSNLGSVTAGDININNKFIVDASGNTTIKSGTSGQRLETTSSLIQVFDSGGTLRVRLGLW